MAQNILSQIFLIAVQALLPAGRPDAQRLQLLAAHRLQHAVRRVGCPVSGDRGRAEVIASSKIVMGGRAKFARPLLIFCVGLGKILLRYIPPGAGTAALGGIKNEQQQW